MSGRNIAGVYGGALLVARARLEAAPGRRVTRHSASVRRADRRGRLEDARTGSVASVGVGDGGAFAHPVDAGRSEIEPAGTGAVTGSVCAAGRRGSDQAVGGVTRVGARRTRETGPHLAGGSTGLAAAQTRAVTTDTFDAMVRDTLIVHSANLSERLKAAATGRTSDARAAIGVRLTGAAARMRVANIGGASDGRARNATSRTVAGSGRCPDRIDAVRCRADAVRVSKALRDGDAIAGPRIATNEIGRTAERTRPLTGFVATIAVSAEAAVALTVAAARKSQREARIVGAGRRTPVAGVRSNSAHVDATRTERDRQGRGQGEANRTTG
jgi:hypothetical protein